MADEDWRRDAGGVPVEDHPRVRVARRVGGEQG